MACKDFIKQCLKRKTIVHSDESDWFLTRHEQCSEKIYTTPELQKTFEAQNSAEYVEISQPAFISSVSGALYIIKRHCRSAVEQTIFSSSYSGPTTIVTIVTPDLYLSINSTEST